MPKLIIDTSDTADVCKACGRWVTKPDFLGFTKHHADDCSGLAAQVKSCPDHRDSLLYHQSAYGCHPIEGADNGKTAPSCDFDSRSG